MKNEERYPVADLVVHCMVEYQSFTIPDTMKELINKDFTLRAVIQSEYHRHRMEQRYGANWQFLDEATRASGSLRLDHNLELRKKWLT